MLRVPACRPEFAEGMEANGLRLGFKGRGYVEIPDSGETLTRTKFQVDHIREVATRPDFVHFAGSPMLVDPGDKRYRGPFMLMWYSKDNTPHSSWVGQQRVLEEI